MNMRLQIARANVKECKDARAKALTLIVETKPSVNALVKIRPLINQISAAEKAAKIDLITYSMDE